MWKRTVFVLALPNLSVIDFAILTMSFSRGIVSVVLKQVAIIARLPSHTLKVPVLTRFLTGIFLTIAIITEMSFSLVQKRIA